MAFGLCAVVAVCLALPASARATGPDVVFTLAGVESSSAPALQPCAPDGGCSVPSDWLPEWTATERRLEGNCVVDLGGDTILLCQGTDLLALGADGRLRRWLRAGVELGVGPLLDVDVGRDDTVVALGQEGVARVSGGVVLRLVPAWDPAGALSETPYGSAIAVGPDGGVLLGGVGGVSGQLTPAALVRLTPDGRPMVVRRAILAGPPVRYTSDELDDLALLSDGSVVLALSGHERVLRVDPDGRVSDLHGWGRRRSGAVTALAVREDGAVLIAADRGLFAVTRTGHLDRIAPGARDPYQPTDPGAVTADGGRSSALRLTRVRRLDVSARGIHLALVEGDYGTRLTAVGPAARIGRLAVAVPGSSRSLLRAGRVDVVATRAAAAEIAIDYGGVQLSRVHASLRPGHNLIEVPVATRPGAQIARVVATDDHGATATHRLAFLSGGALSWLELRRLVRDYKRSVTDAVTATTVDRCRRRDATEIACRVRHVNEAFRSVGVAVFRRLPNGLVRYTGLDRRGRIRDQWLMEPR